MGLVGPVHLFWFNLRSLLTEYGITFLFRVVFPHPVKTFRGIKKYLRDEKLSMKPSSQWIGNVNLCQSGNSLLGLGFCLKPLEPVCISERPNHNCYYFENSQYLTPAETPDCCLNCQIRIMGLAALQTGSCLYIMTSAHDVLQDLLLPALRKKTFKNVVLILCAYSLRPFKLALDICGLEAAFFSFAEGDCADYATWRKADKGNKAERTCCAPDIVAKINRLLKTGDKPAGPAEKFQKKGHIFFYPDRK